MDLPSVSIIIPTRNRHELLKRCISPVIEYVKAHSECTIIVSDDGRASGTRGALGAEPGIVQVVQGPGRGPAANRNCGAAQASTELLIFLDDDCIPDGNLIAAYQDAALKNPGIGVFEGRISAIGRETSFADVAPVNETGGKLWSCNFAIRRELFVTIIGFDDRYPFPAMEDVDLQWRVKGLSQVLFVPEARVWHAFEQRLGWKGVRHHALSVLLYMHIHGLEATERGPAYFLSTAARMFVDGVLRQIKGHAAKNPQQRIFHVLVCLQLATITLLWRFHGRLAMMFFPPCCPDCKSIQSQLR
jgi:GT2 family glycosyltransferase